MIMFLDGTFGSISYSGINLKSLSHLQPIRLPMSSIVRENFENSLSSVTYDDFNSNHFEVINDVNTIVERIKKRS